MSALAPLLTWLHLALGIAWAAGALALLVGGRTDGRAAFVSRFAAAMLATTTPLLLLHGGWWPDMPDRYLVPGLAALGLAALHRPERPTGRLSRLMLAGFWLGLGALAVRNGTPLSLPVAIKALGLGAALLLAAAPPQSWPRSRQALTIALLALAGAIGFAGEIPFG